MTQFVARSRKRYCPVCKQFVIGTLAGKIWRHRDSAGHDTCPMSGEPYELSDMGRVRLRKNQDGAA